MVSIQAGCDAGGPEEGHHERLQVDLREGGLEAHLQEAAQRAHEVPSCGARPVLVAADREALRRVATVAQQVADSAWQLERRAARAQAFEKVTPRPAQGLEAATSSS